MSAHENDANGVERLREPAFVGGVVLGVLVVAVGLAFLILGLAMDTVPPAPYFETTTDRILVLGGAVGAMVVGAGVVRGSARLAGW